MSWKAPASLALFGLVAACEQPYVPTSLAVFHELSDPCTSKVGELSQLSQLAEAGARGPQYVEKAGAIAAVCTAARDDLSVRKAPSPCTEIAERVRTSAENLKFAFEDRKDGPDRVLVLTQRLQPIIERCMKKLTPPEPVGARRNT